MLLKVEKIKYSSIVPVFKCFSSSRPFLISGNVLFQVSEDMTGNSRFEFLSKFWFKTFALIITKVTS